ncbi:MAG: hydroxysqualene dehydroxylase HpnE [Proteobacteria bacterium]|nr:hydroxysqualene dehydroxylase HpnE [Pseudomonadota bacterium]MCA0324239.1 hydroxysqualene dehydroxylase HpnE [Pseudomonadota bacterium]
MAGAVRGTAGSGGALRLAVIGGGWAGLSAAVHAVQRGHAVTLFEMARHWGGRARSLPDTDGLDNGQHILIGAYRDTLALMRTVGVDPDKVLLRRPLALCGADGQGLRLEAGPAAWAFAAAVLRSGAWPWRERIALLHACAGWARAGFACRPDRSVAELCAALPSAVRLRLIDPLCVAALNTPAAEASAAVFLRVLRDGLFGGRGACDLLLPRRPLNALLPEPAARWLAGHGAELRPGQRVTSLVRDAAAWQVDGRPFDGVVLACPAAEAARLAAPLAPAWAALAAGLRFEPIVTVTLRCRGARLALPMLALAEDARSPAQFVFDHAQLGGPAGRFSFVVSGAARWVAAGLDACAAATQRQAAEQLAASGWQRGQASLEAVFAERRATFRCTPALQRPPAVIAPGLAAAGDYVAGPYPATLEGAVRAGIAALEALEPREALHVPTMQNRVSSSSNPP